jgi:predicted PurR-regulated permease PerM
LGRFGQARANIRRAYESGRETARARRAERARLATLEAQEQPKPSPEPDPEPEPAIDHATTASRDDLEVPVGLRVAAAWGWRLLIIGVLVFYALKIIDVLSNVIIPLTIALLLSALLSPFVRILTENARLPRSLATAIVVVAGIAAVGAILTAVVTQFVDGLPQLSDKTAQGVQDIREWLKAGPLHLTNAQLDGFGAAAQKWFVNNRERLTTSAVSTAAATLEALTGFFLVLFSLYFFLRDGRTIWRFFVGVMPRATRDALDHAGQAAWSTLGSYVRATVIVAFIDAFGIALVLTLVKVPSAFIFPLAALVFLFSFVPIIGATVSGAVAVLVAGVTVNWVTALIVLAGVIGVQQLEGHVLQPLIMGKAVAIHPLAVIAAIAGGLVLAGIIGALVAVPMVAMFNTGIRALLERRRQIRNAMLSESANREAAEARPA